MSRRTIAVTGATGNVGRYLVPLLHDAGLAVRALSRSGEPPVDLLDPATLDPAFAGADAVFLMWPGTSADGAAPVVEAIARHARRVVFLSAIGAEGTFHGRVEELIESTGLEWTFLRGGGFAANALGWAKGIRESGEVRWIHGDAGRSLVHEADIAAVAARTLTEDGHGGRRYELTGPSAVTQREQVRLIGEAVGRELGWIELSEVEIREMLLASGWSEEFIGGALAHWASIVERPEPVTGGVAEVTGVAPRSFAQWARDHADDFS
jgi:uncharacterized protein YbjT (DUF2867 family)